MDKTYKKICLPSAFTCRQANFQIPLPLTQCCLLGHEQLPGKHRFPHQHCIRGRGGGRSNCGRIMKGETVSEWFFGCLCSLSLHRGRGWEGEVKKWFLFCSFLVFSRSFVHDCKTAKCFPKQGEPKFGQIHAKSKAALKFNISRLCSQTFNCLIIETIKKYC